MRQSTTRPRADAALLVLLAVAAALPYFRVGGFGFVFDDSAYVWGNPALDRGLTPELVRWAFTTFHTGNWHPLTWISHALDRNLLGAAPGPQHLVNVILHALNSLLLFLFLRAAGIGRAVSVTVAALFGVHPVHVESVAWISERKDLLSGFFFFATLITYTVYARQPTILRAGAVTGLFACGLLSKAMVVTLPLILLLLDYWPLGRMSGPTRFLRRVWPLALEKLHLAVLSLAVGIVTLVAQKAASALGSLQEFILSKRLANALFSMVDYLGMAAWPHALSPFYPYPASIAPAWRLGAAAFALAVLFLAALLLRRRFPHLAVGMLWYAIMMLPVIGILQVGSQARADRYLYLPLAGLLLIAVCSVGNLIRGTRLPRVATVALASLAVLGYGIAAHLQARHWRDNLTLFSRAAHVAPASWLVEGNLGHALLERRQYGEAAKHLAEAIRLYPDNYEAHLNLGTALSALSRPEEALRAYERAARINPSSTQPYFNSALLYVGLRRKADAVAMYRIVSGLAPGQGERLLPFIATLP